MRSNIARGEITNTASFKFINKSVINVTTVLDREGRNLETKRVFFSIIEAARYFDVPVNVLYGHLKGKFPDVDGFHFERVSLVAE